MDAGVFHDAHEVYWVEDEKREWVATFATKEYAQGYVRWAEDAAAEYQTNLEDHYEIVPV